MTLMGNLMLEVKTTSRHGCVSARSGKNVTSV